MPPRLFRNTLAVTGWGSLAATLGYVLWTRKSEIHPLAPTDRIFNSTLFARYNPNGTPAMHDVCLRKVPIGSVREELLQAHEQGSGALVERFCAGVCSGWGELICCIYCEART